MRQASHHVVLNSSNIVARESIQKKENKWEFTRGSPHSVVASFQFTAIAGQVISKHNMAIAFRDRCWMDQLMQAVLAHSSTTKDVKRYFTVTKRLGEIPRGDSTWSPIRYISPAGKSEEEIMSAIEEGNEKALKVQLKFHVFSETVANQLMTLLPGLQFNATIEKIAALVVQKGEVKLQPPEYKDGMKQFHQDSADYPPAVCFRGVGLNACYQPKDKCKVACQTWVASAEFTRAESDSVKQEINCQSR